MGSPELDNSMESNEDRSTEQSDSSCYSDISEILGDQLIHPRVGDEYQAQIPPLMKDYDYLHSVNTPFTEAKTKVSGCFLVGLPIPVMWTHNGEKHNKAEIMEVCGGRDNGVSGENHSSGYEAPKDGHLDSTVDNGEELWVSTNAHPMEGVEINVGIESQEGEMALNHMDKCLVPLPGCLGEPWSNIEHDRFLLGLYIFGKNLLVVKRFIGCKGMGDIQSFYYGKFYKSEEHRRWSECRKTKSRKSIHGQKIFTGWRQQEVLSRLFSEVSEQCRNMLLEAGIAMPVFSDGQLVMLSLFGEGVRFNWRVLDILRVVKEEQTVLNCDVGNLEDYISTLVCCIYFSILAVKVSRTFAEGKISLEEYVFTLRDAVGIEKLIEAVGIGKGKLDLTGTASETTKTKYDFTIRREMPIGKSCSSLTSEDIIKLLTADFRLSKARTNDLFWEAVWPRLLARGWHSEQPKDYVFTGSKDCLVFLIPGVNEFSRRNLVKGNDYFDSLRQVLKKVAADPKLLELESDVEIRRENKEEENKDIMVKQGLVNVSSERNKQSVGYLKPRISSCSQEVMKFTIVDTSLDDSEERLKIRELRTLPNENTTVSPASSYSSETKQGASEMSGDEPEEFDALDPAKDVVHGEAHVESLEQHGLTNNGLNSAIFVAEDHEGQDIALPHNQQLRKNVVRQLSQQERSSHTIKTASAKNNGLITVCSHKKSGDSNENMMEEIETKGEFDSLSSSPDEGQSLSYRDDSSQNLLPASFLDEDKDMPDVNNKEICNENSPCTQSADEEGNLPGLSDLNLPHVPPASEAGDHLGTKNIDNDDKNDLSTFFITNQQTQLLKTLDGGISTGQQHSLTNGRRQSTRNRPLSTKALEALSCEFVTSKRKRKALDAQSSRKVRARNAAGASYRNNVDNATAETKIEV
ncbi:hypothetical protein RJ641_030479 [Dillenia turbinata]|uniref:SANT domain-containing protein n=1 Tax=Dillenia turbinata TaxID=194707 RepID=A0AAN8W6P7_9MAGN